MLQTNNRPFSVFDSHSAHCQGYSKINPHKPCPYLTRSPRIDRENKRRDIEEGTSVGILWIRLPQNYILFENDTNSKFTDNMRLCKVIIPL